jgi:hypothetical protein
LERDVKNLETPTVIADYTFRILSVIGDSSSDFANFGILVVKLLVACGYTEALTALG